MPPTLSLRKGGRHFHRGDMSEDGDKTRGDRRDEKRQKRRYSPKVHGKRLAELVRNALKRRLGKRG